MPWFGSLAFQSATINEYRVRRARLNRSRVGIFRDTRAIRSTGPNRLCRDTATGDKLKKDWAFVFASHRKGAHATPFQHRAFTSNDVPLFETIRTPQVIDAQLDLCSKSGLPQRRRAECSTCSLSSLLERKTNFSMTSCSTLEVDLAC